jgi:hypothetical protein
MEKDLVRNVQFVAGCLSAGGVEYSAFTFYLRDNESVLKSEGEQYCREKKSFFEAEAMRVVGDRSALLVDVEVKTLEQHLFDSAEAAYAADEETGCPAHVAEGHWHTVYGIIGIYKPTYFVTHEQGPKADLVQGDSAFVSDSEVVL